MRILYAMLPGAAQYDNAWHDRRAIIVAAAAVNHIRTGIIVLYLLLLKMLLVPGPRLSF